MSDTPTDDFRYEDPMLPFVDTENGERFEPPAWQRNVYAAGSGAVRRKKPSKKVQGRILLEQGHRCFYCGLKFESVVERCGRYAALVINWDHVVPHSYQARNKGFVAACQICNGIKGAMMFEMAEEARRYIASRWRAKGYALIEPDAELLGDSGNSSTDASEREIASKSLAHRQFSES
jgi:hypothetical protein